MRIPAYILISIITAGSLFAQGFPPAAGQEGSTAIHMDSPAFIAWADSCFIERGPAIITVPDSLEVCSGLPTDATGKAGEGKVVSLGDGGVATLYFTDPVADGPGPDFAVFENAFTDNFLELAFVEVSSDGYNYFRFPAESLTPVNIQTGSFGILDPVDINGLAGKYRAGYGTPFDLAELATDPLLDMGNIHWVRVQDVIGCIIDTIGSRDILGRIINDPWPTAFTTGGFDLDAVGVINGIKLQSPSRHMETLRVDPNPFSDRIQVSGRTGAFRILDLRGSLQIEGELHRDNTLISTAKLPAGCYLLILNRTEVQKIVKMK